MRMDWRRKRAELPLYDFQGFGGIFLGTGELDMCDVIGGLDHVRVCGIGHDVSGVP